MTDILKNVLNIAARIHDMQAAGTLAMAFFGIVLVFGLVNCILGYRLLRFWMMIFGFLMGAGAGFFGVYEAGASDKTIYVVVMLIAGVVLAVISFAIFKAGIFIIGAGIGLTVTIYLIHPTTSFTFFLCLLTGVGLGFLALRYEREVIIVGTSTSRNFKRLCHCQADKYGGNSFWNHLFHRLCPGGNADSVCNQQAEIRG